MTRGTKFCEASTTRRRTINTIGYVKVQPTAKFNPPPLTRVPSYPDLPMEDVYPRQPKTDIPEVFLRKFNAGRVAYFPGNLEQTFWEVLDPDHGRILANVVNWALNEPAILSVEGRGVLDVSLWEQANSLTVHLVNLTNPMMMKGPIRELFSIDPQRVSLRLPAGRHAAKCSLALE